MDLVTDVNLSNLETEIITAKDDNEFAPASNTTTTDTEQKLSKRQLKRLKKKEKWLSLLSEKR